MRRNYQDISVYGICDACNEPLVPVYFTEKEYDKSGIPTGRVRKIIDVLSCPSCLRNYCTDGNSFNGQWIRPSFAEILNQKMAAYRQ